MLRKIKRCSNKRAIDLQFNWIFVLIGGAIFLGFFISLIRNLDTGETQKTSQESTQELDSLLKISSAVSDAQKTVLFKSERTITFSCRNNISEYYVEGAAKSARYDYSAIFSPVELRDKELVIQTLMFEAPFRVLPIVYVTDKRIEYVFVGNSPLINIVFNSMPSSATKKLISTDPYELINYRDYNYDQVVFVLDDAGLLTGLTLVDPSFNNARNRVFAVAISALGGQIEVGDLGFYRYIPNVGFAGGFLNGDTVPFFETSLGQGKSTLILGGVISHDKDIYACNLQKVLRRLKLMAELHYQRLSAYTEHYEAVNALDPVNSIYNCNDNYYEGAKGNLTAMAYAEEPSFSANDLMILRLEINNLEYLNRLIMIMGDCARIY